MRLETLPLILGAIIALLGLGLIIDSRVADRAPRRERRRRLRLERSRGGELMVGLGVLAMAAAIVGRDTWRYSILSILIGAFFLLIGAWMNRRYLRELIFNRGAARRRPEGMQDRPMPGMAARPSAAGAPAPRPDAARAAEAPPAGPDATRPVVPPAPKRDAPHRGPA